MSRHTYELIGRDVKTPRKVARIRKNRFKQTYARWLFPALIALASLGILFVGIR